MSETQTPDNQFGDAETANLPAGTEPPANTNDSERPDQKPEDPEWLRRRIDRFTRQRTVIERERDEARAELHSMRQQARQGAPPQDNRANDQPQQQGRSEEQIRNDERARLTERQAADQFTARSGEVAQKAAATYGQDGFQAAYDNWNRVGLDLTDKSHAALLRDIVALPDAEHIYHHIGTDPDLASRLLDMNERDAYAELQGIARARPWTATEQGEQAPAPANARPQVSNAPRPAARQPGPARSSSRTVYDRDLPMADFVAMRNKKP